MTLDGIGQGLHPAAVHRARGNAKRLGLRNLSIRQAPLSAMQRPDGMPGLLVTNPPYGERIGTDVAPLYTQLGDLLRRRMLGWSAGILTPAGPLSKRVGLRTQRRHVLFNGPLECRLLTFDISTEAPQGDKPTRQS